MNVLTESMGAAMPVKTVLSCAVLLVLALQPHASAQNRQAQPAGPQPVGAVQGPQPAGPPAAPLQGPAAPQQPPKAPFELTPQQQEVLMRVLRAWEERSNKIRTLSCDFTRWDYDPVFGQPDPDNPNAVIPKQSKGVLKYAAPDKVLYRIEEITEYAGMENGEKKFQKRPEGGEHWVCDGLAIWEYNHQKKQLIERRLPPELQGKAIADGPLPFLFGAQADKLMQRYWMRLVTPPDVPGQIWLEAFPKYSLDAANFRRATLILDQKTMLPHAIEVTLPNGKSRHVHQFEGNVVNNLFRIFQGDFAKPALPRGWTKIEETARSPEASHPRG